MIHDSMSVIEVAPHFPHEGVLYHVPLICNLWMHCQVIAQGEVYRKANVEFHRSIVNRIITVTDRSQIFLRAIVR